MPQPCLLESLIAAAHEYRKSNFDAFAARIRVCGPAGTYHRQEFPAPCIIPGAPSDGRADAARRTRLSYTPSHLPESLM